MGSASFVGPHKVKYGKPGRVDIGGEVTARDIIIATGSVPFVPPGKEDLPARVAKSDRACETPKRSLLQIQRGFMFMSFLMVVTVVILMTDRYPHRREDGLHQ